MRRVSASPRESAPVRASPRPVRVFRASALHPRSAPVRAQSAYSAIPKSRPGPSSPRRAEFPVGYVGPGVWVVGSGRLELERAFKPLGRAGIAGGPLVN